MATPQEHQQTPRGVHDDRECSNENANGLLRQYFPKGTNLNVFSPEHLRAVEDEINNRPRLILEDRTPAELFTALLASPDQPLRR